jgi:hypothetical protein
MAGHYLAHPWTTWRPKWHELCVLPFYNSLFEGLPMYPVRYAAFAAASVLLSAASALAGSTYTFTTSTGVQPSDVGTITLTQVDSTTVDVLVDLSDTSMPLPEYGFINTGGPHTPFAFTISGTEAGVSATFLQPSGGNYAFGMFSLNPNGGDATPFGSYGIAIDSTAGNGSGKAYYGDLGFTVSRTGGLSTDDFITNALIDPGSSAYFAPTSRTAATTLAHKHGMFGLLLPPRCQSRPASQCRALRWAALASPIAGGAPPDRRLG